MSEKVFVIPLLLSIPAESYGEAMQEAEDLVEDLGVDAGMGVEVARDFEHDNHGQRVLYLHPEEDPDWEPGDEEEDDEG